MILVHIFLRMFEAFGGMVLDVLNGIDDALCDDGYYDCDEEDTLYDQRY